jgi:hypothetical protein
MAGAAEPKFFSLATNTHTAGQTLTGGSGRLLPLDGAPRQALGGIRTDRRFPEFHTVPRETAVSAVLAIADGTVRAIGGVAAAATQPAATSTTRAKVATQSVNPLPLSRSG